MELRPLGTSGLLVAEVGICPGDGPAREAVVRRALDRGCRLFWSERPVAGAQTLPGDLEGRFGVVRYNLLDQKEANEAIARLSREGKGVVATHVLAGGALAGAAGHAPYGARVAQLRFLVRPGRSLAQAALQFVLANESVSCAVVRASRPEHVDEALSAPDAPPLTGRELEQIFELWANRFE
jgi:aryl-alcohol dehydrogenase-like predicted oxidoreductase